MLIIYLALIPVAGVFSYCNEISAPLPITCGINEEYSPCRIKCPPQSCNISYTDFLCPMDDPCEPGCNCIKDHLRNNEGICVFNEECPPPPQIPSCGDNEVGSTCRKTCPPDSCDFDPTKEACKPGPCQPGCNCIENYLRDATGKCVPKDQCPKRNMCDPLPITCGINEEYSPCRIKCPPQSCNISYTDFLCPMDDPCEPGCNCIKDHLRNNEGICVFNEECPPPPQIPSCGDNEVGSTCRKTCPPDSCDFDPTKEACKPGPCQPGCNCIENYLRDATGKCIPKDQCPKSNMCETISCDRNASCIECPSPCPSTCQAPNEIQCRKQCSPYGCQCKPSYLLSKPKGQCILPKDCPGGYPCPKNETFVPCNIRCPNIYCPVDDSLGRLICDPPSRCPSGCSCKPNYKRKSVNDNRCILASECPRVKCTRDNEEWHSCPPTYFNENCFDIISNTSHNSIRSECRPRCVCKKGYYRNDSGLCVPKAECFPSKKCEIPYKCRRTCAEPNPPNCPAYSNVSKNVKGCKCKPGFILSQKDGECVRIEDCPQQKGCNGDNNAHITKCPAPCPSTCQSPNQVPCKKACLDVGCACNDGNILSELNGKCIKPDDCPGGNPCGRNATFRTCNNRCPYNYCPVDDSPPDFSCVPPSPCPSGCVCNLNYRKKSINEDKCILASECTPVNCTRCNEVWSPCPSDCLREDCENAGEEETVCNTLVLNCQPKCICKPNTFRDENKICVPVEQCPKKNPQPYE